MTEQEEREQAFDSALRLFVGGEVLRVLKGVHDAGLVEILLGAIEDEDGRTLPAIKIVLHPEVFADKLAGIIQQAQSAGLESALRAAMTRPAPRHDA